MHAVYSTYLMYDFQASILCVALESKFCENVTVPHFFLGRIIEMFFYICIMYVNVDYSD